MLPPLEQSTSITQLQSSISTTHIKFSSFGITLKLKIGDEYFIQCFIYIINFHPNFQYVKMTLKGIIFSYSFQQVGLDRCILHYIRK